MACRQPANAGSRGGGEPPDEESITKGVSSLESLSIICEGFPEDVAKNVYPDIKNFSGTQKYYLVLYPLGSSGKIKVTFTPKVGSALSGVMLDGFDVNADAPSAQRNNEADDGDEPVDDDDGTPSAYTYTVDVLTTDTAHKLDIALSNLDYGESITYTLSISGVNSTGGGMKEVIVPASGNIEIPADILSGAYFAHIQFAGGENRLKKLILDTLTVGVNVNVGLEGATSNQSKWKLNEGGSITVTQGSPLISAIYVGPKYYYDFLYATDEIDSQMATLNRLIGELKDELRELEIDVDGLNVGQAQFAESLLEEAPIPTHTPSGGNVVFTLTGEHPASTYNFAYFKLSGGEIWHNVSFTGTLPATVIPEVTLDIVGNDVTITAPAVGGVPAVEPQRFFFGTTAASYSTVHSLGTQLGDLISLIDSDYATIAAVEAAVNAKANEAVDLLVAGLTAMIGEASVLRSAADDAANTLSPGSTFATLTTAANKITAVQSALAQVINSHDASIASINNALDILNSGEYGGDLDEYVDSFTSQTPAHQRAHSVSFAYATASSSSRPDGEGAGHFISRLGRYIDSGNYDAHQTFMPIASLKRYERHTAGGQGDWGAWTRTDAAFAVDYVRVRNVGYFSGSLDTFITEQQQPLNSTYFGYSNAAGGALGKPANDNGVGFFTSEIGQANTDIYQSWRPAASPKVYERRMASGAWTRTDAAFAAETNAMDVGEINTGNCSTGLNDFITAFSQPVGSSYTGSVAAGLTEGKPSADSGVAGYFTSYRAAENVSYQTFRPISTPKVYERTKNSGDWGAWVRTDAGSLAGAAESAAAALKVRNVGNIASGSLNTFSTSIVSPVQPANSTYHGFVSSTSLAGLPESSTGFFTSEIGDTQNIIHQTFRPAGTTRVWERYSSNGGGAWSPAWTRTDAEAVAAALNVRNVGNILPSAVDDNLNNFALKYSQPAGSTYYASFTSGSPSGNWPENTAGFFTSYVGQITLNWTDYISRQEYRPSNSNKVYERNRGNGSSWSAWERTDTASATQLTISRASGAPMNSDPGSWSATFKNGFLTIYVANAYISAQEGTANFSDNTPLFRITGVNHSGPNNGNSFAFPVIFINGNTKWGCLANDGTSLNVRSEWAQSNPYPRSVEFGFTVTIPAVLTQ